MTMGTPIVAADRPYARESCGDAAVYFNPHLPAASAVAIGDLLEDDEKRRKLVQRGFEVVAKGLGERHYDRMMEHLVTFWRRTVRKPSEEDAAVEYGGHLKGDLATGIRQIDRSKSIVFTQKPIP
jgi:hypothetical protein